MMCMYMHICMCICGIYVDIHVHERNCFILKKLQHSALSLFCTPENIAENAWTDFHEIFNKGRTWDKQRSVTFLGCCYAVNPLNPGSLFLFPGMVFVSNVMEKRVSGFSWNFHDTSRTSQEIIIETVSGLPRLFHGLTSRHHSVSVGNITVKWMSRFS